MATATLRSSGSGSGRLGSQRPSSMTFDAKKKKKTFAEDFVSPLSVEDIRRVVTISYQDCNDIATRLRPAIVPPEAISDTSAILERLRIAPSNNSASNTLRRRKPTGVPTPRQRAIAPSFPMAAMKGAEALAIAGQTKLVEFLRMAEGQKDVTLFYTIAGKAPEDIPLYRSLLHMACEKNLDTIVPLLVGQGISPDVCDSEGVTPLVLAAAQGCTLAVRALLAVGANAGLATPDGRLPLQEALLFGHYETADMLLASGKVNVNLRCDDGLSGLLLALQCKSGADLVACCRLLCAYGPDLNVASPGLPPKLGPETALDMCVRRCLRLPDVFGIVAGTKSPREVSSAVLDAVDGQGRSILLRCLQARCYDAARGLLHLGADPAIVPVSKPGRPPPDNCLIMSIRVGHLDIGLAVMQAAIMEGANAGDVHGVLSSPDAHGYHPALLAAHRVDPLEVRHWIGLFIKYAVELHTVATPSPSRAQFKMGERMGSSLLLELVRRGHVEAAMRLWDYYDETGHAVNVNEADADGRSLVFYACYRFQRNDRSPILLRLLRAGAKLDSKDSFGVSPLMAACRADNFRACLMLCNEPADYGAGDASWERDVAYTGTTAVNEADNGGLTPLWYAVLHDNPLLCDFLIARGADCNKRCSRGRTALVLAVRISKHKKLDVFKVLLGLGKADPSIRDDKGNNAFDYAVLKEFEMNCRPMTNYFTRTLGTDALRDTVQLLLTTETLCVGETNKGWGVRPGNVVEKYMAMMTFGATLMFKKDGGSSALKKVFKAACIVVPCDRRYIGARVECVYEGGKDILKDEAKAQSKEAAKALAVMAVKTGASAAAAYAGIDSSVVDTVIDLVELAVDVLQDMWEAYQAAREGLRILTDGDFEGVGRKHDPPTYGCHSYQREQQLLHVSGTGWHAFAPFKGPKELKPCGVSYKHKPLKLRVGEKVTVAADGTEMVVVRLYSDKTRPYLAACMCVSHDDLPCDMRRFARDELVSLDYPLEDKAIKGELLLSVRHDDVTDRLVVTPHVVSKCKDGKKKFFVSVALKGAACLGENGSPLMADALRTPVSEAGSWEGPTIELHQLMADELAGETLFVQVWTEASFRSVLLGGVAITLDSVGAGPIDRVAFQLVKDYKENAVSLDVEEDEGMDGTSLYGLSASLPQDVLTHIDNRHMAAGPPAFGGELWDWQETVASIKGSLLEVCRSLQSQAIPAEQELERMFAAVSSKVAKLDKTRRDKQLQVTKSFTRDKQIGTETMQKTVSKMATKSASDLVQTLKRSRTSVSDSGLALRQRDAHEAATAVVVQDTLKRHYFYACRVARLNCVSLLELRAVLLKHQKKAKLAIARALRLVLSSNLSHLQSGLGDGARLEVLAQVRTCYKDGRARLDELFRAHFPRTDLHLKPWLMAAWKAEEKALFKVAFGGKDMESWGLSEGPEAHGLTSFMDTHTRRLSSSESLPSSPGPASPSPASPGLASPIKAWVDIPETDAIS